MGPRCESVWTQRTAWRGRFAGVDVLRRGSSSSAPVCQVGRDTAPTLGSLHALGHVLLLRSPGGASGSGKPIALSTSQR